VRRYVRRGNPKTNPTSLAVSKAKRELTRWQVGAQPFDSASPNLRMNRAAARFTSSAPIEYLRPRLCVGRATRSVKTEFKRRSTGKIAYATYFASVDWASFSRKYS
jgi:hypothetical protein